MGPAVGRCPAGLWRQPCNLARPISETGIDLKAYNVNGNVTSFGKKDVSFSLGGVDYKYGGIGVAGSGGRDAETDFVNSSKTERIEACFDTALTKATIGVAALFGGPGAAYDGPHTEKLLWKAYNANGNLIGSGTVSGDQDGLVQFSIEIPGQSIKKIVLCPAEDLPNADVGGKESDFLLQFIDGKCLDVQNEVFTYKLEDSDGDQSSAKLTISINDTNPVANDDNNSTIEGGTAIGNVLTGLGSTVPAAAADTIGQDAAGAAIREITYNGTTYTLANTDANGWVDINTSLGGKLHINLLTGAYSFTAPADIPGATAQETFTYVLGDNEGVCDTDSAVLTITIAGGPGEQNPPSELPPTAGTQAIIVDDEGLPNGNLGNGTSSGDINVAPDPEHIANGTLIHDFEDGTPAAARPDQLLADARDDGHGRHRARHL